MQKYSAVQFPLETHWAIKTQSRVEIDVPWGLLQETKCISALPRAQGSSSAVPYLSRVYDPLPN